MSFTILNVISLEQRLHWMVLALEAPTRLDRNLFTLMISKVKFLQE